MHKDWAVQHNLSTQTVGRSIEHKSEDLIAVFNHLFGESLNTRLISGDDEPIYVPASDHVPYNQVIFAHGFYSSALHEVAHWCIAGDKRRQQVDYGYWYSADGRSAQQQAKFEKVEIKPQALEWIFSKACSKSFRISVDNLNGEHTDSYSFKYAVYQQVLDYCEQGIPSRAAIFREALCSMYQHPGELVSESFSFSEF